MILVEYQLECSFPCGGGDSRVSGDPRSLLPLSPKQSAFTGFIAFPTQFILKKKAIPRKSLDTSGQFHFYDILYLECPMDTSHYSIYLITQAGYPFYCILRVHCCFDLDIQNLENNM